MPRSSLLDFLRVDIFGLLAIVLLLCAVASNADATFSICAVDPVTGEVGSAGASCISGSIILSDVYPDRGVVHTQAFWNSQNQQYAGNLMEAGFSPQEIVDMVVANDAQGNPTIRQYGVVDLIGGGRSASYTGVNTTDYAGHILGPTYAIQGNILLGAQILEDMEEAFLDTPGVLAQKLMAALQAAKVPGADTRCSCKSSISAFVRVARPSDSEGDLYLDLNVNSTFGCNDPIDELQDLFDDWLASSSVPGGPETPGAPGSDGIVDAESGSILRLAHHPNPTRAAATIEYELSRPAFVRLRVFDPAGRVAAVLENGSRAAGSHAVRFDPSAWLPGGGVFLYQLEAGREVRTGKLISLPK